MGLMWNSIKAMKKLISTILCVFSLHAADVVPSANIPPAGWVPGVTVGVEGGIPTGWTSATTISAGSTISTINSAISSSANDRVVDLAAGNFASSTTSLLINRDRVILRGATNAQGVPTTRLIFTDGSLTDGIILLAKSSSYPMNNWAGVNSATIASDLTVGQSNVTLSGVSGLAVGQPIWFDVPYEDSLLWYSTPPCPTGEGGNIAWNRSGRMPLHGAKVKAIVGNTVEFWPPIAHPYFDALGSNGAWWHGSGSANILSKVGLENLIIDFDGTGANHVIQFINAADCWMRNIYLTNAPSGGAHIRTSYSINIEVRDCFTRKHMSVGSATYAVWALYSSGLLVENNIFYDTPCAIGFQASFYSVVGYNFVRKMPYSAPAWLPESVMFGHGGHVNFVLVEGNRLPSIWADHTHGNGSYNTFSRNYVTGSDPDESKTDNTDCVNIESGNPNFVFAGNNFGTQGYHTSYETTNDRRIYQLDNAVTRIYNWNSVNDAVPASEAIGGSTIRDSYYLTSSGLEHGLLGDGPYYGPDVTPLSVSDSDIPAGYRFANGEWQSGSSSYVQRTKKQGNMILKGTQTIK
jgi:hypothetical protein